MALTLDGTAGISATGNIYGNNIIVTNNLTAGAFSPTTLSSTGNVVGGNILTGGLVSATGNITGSYILGNGSLLTGIDATSIQNGTSSVAVIASGGNVRTNIAGATIATTYSGGVAVTGIVSATGNITGGNLSGTSIVGTLTTAAQTNITSVGTLGSLTVTGNISGGNLSGTSIVGTLTTAAQTNITSVGTLGSLTVTGNITGGNVLGGANVNATTHTGTTVSVTGAITGGAITGSSLTVTTGNITGGNIVNGGTNGVGNIGSATTYFNTVFAKATSAQYADVAELYVADKEYAPGTVLDFGGTNEVTASSSSHSVSIAGVVSTNPAYIMNSTQTGTHLVQLALLGRVPCCVVGSIQKGDRLVSSGIPGVAQRLSADQYNPGCIIGKALENYNSNDIGTIEVVVGRL